MAATGLRETSHAGKSRVGFGLKRAIVALLVCACGVAGADDPSKVDRSDAFSIQPETLGPFTVGQHVSVSFSVVNKATLQPCDVERVCAGWNDHVDGLRIVRQPNSFESIKTLGEQWVPTENDGVRAYTLPFDFPTAGTTVRTFSVSDNELDAELGGSEGYGTASIHFPCCSCSPLYSAADDGLYYYASASEGIAVFRIKAHEYIWDDATQSAVPGPEINYAITLHADGRIVMSYGYHGRNDLIVDGVIVNSWAEFFVGDESYPCQAWGEFSTGWNDVPEYQSDTTPDIVFVPAWLPPGLRLECSFGDDDYSSDRLTLLGTPLRGGDYAFSLTAELARWTSIGDGENTFDEREDYGFVTRDYVIHVNGGSVGPSVATLPDLPEDAQDADVEEALESIAFADEGVAAAILGADDPVIAYLSFCDWAQNVTGGEAAVIASAHAMESFAFGVTDLFEHTPEATIASCEVSSAGTEGGVVFSVTVQVKDGADAKAVASEKVAEMFEATSDLSDWTAGKLTPVVTDLTQGTDDSVRFRVQPGDGTAKSAFLRIRSPYATGGGGSSTSEGGNLGVDKRLGCI